MFQNQSSFGVVSRHDDKTLLEAIETAAIMIDKLGDVVLPLYERLEEEYFRRQRSKDALGRAAAILQEGRLKLLP